MEDDPPQHPLTDNHQHQDNDGDNCDDDGRTQIDEELVPAPILPLSPSPPPVNDNGGSTIREREQLPPPLPPTSSVISPATPATRSLSATDSDEYSFHQNLKTGDNQMIKDSPSSVKYLLSKQEKLLKEDIDGGPVVDKGPVDLLSPMRDSKALSAIQEV